MTPIIYGKPRVSKALRPQPDAAIRRTFNRYDEENPDLPIETILEMTATHHSIPVSTTIAALWG
jgi:hypothetical protein